jgi:hypothetical protein
MRFKQLDPTTTYKAARASGFPGRDLPAGRFWAAIAAVFLVAACSGGGASPVPTAASSPTATIPTSTPAPTPTRVPTPAPTPLPALTLLWQAGGPVPKQPSTWAPAVDPLSGDIWVADGFESRFWIFSPDGKYLESWGTPGKADGQFDFIWHAPNPSAFGSIAFAPDGTFYVSDVGNNRVQKFTKNRVFVKAWGTFGSGNGQFAQPLDIVTDGKTVYVGDGVRSDIQAFDTSGTFLRSFGGDLGSSTFLAIGAAGQVYASNPASGHPANVAKYDSTGKLLATYDTSFVRADPVGVAVAGDGSIYVSFDTRQAQPVATWKLDAAGTPIQGWSTAGESLLVAPDGKALYMAYQDPNNGWPYIQKYVLP